MGIFAGGKKNEQNKTKDVAIRRTGYRSRNSSKRLTPLHLTPPLPPGLSFVLETTMVCQVPSSNSFCLWNKYFKLWWYSLVDTRFAVFVFRFNVNFALFPWHSHVLLLHILQPFAKPTISTDLFALINLFLLKYVIPINPCC